MKIFKFLETYVFPVAKLIIIILAVLYIVSYYQIAYNNPNLNELHIFLRILGIEWD